MSPTSLIPYSQSMSAAQFSEEPRCQSIFIGWLPSAEKPTWRLPIPRSPFIPAASLPYRELRIFWLCPITSPQNIMLTLLSLVFGVPAHVFGWIMDQYSTLFCAQTTLACRCPCFMLDCHQLKQVTFRRKNGWPKRSSSSMMISIL